MRQVIWLCCCSFSAFSSSALAQESSASSANAKSGSTNELGEIIVTAQKRAQRLSDVGVTITAATGAQLESAGVADVTDLPRVAPGLTMGFTQQGYAVFSLRGVNFNAAQIAAPQAVSVYADEAALPYAPQTAGAFLDVERVEVIKGPQGTLFGQNATGGSINIIAAKPTDVLSGGFSAEVNNYGQMMLEGFVSGPLSDTVRARLAGTTTQFGAWQKGYFGNNQKNGDQNRGAARLLLDWEPSDRAKVSLNINGNYDRGEVIQQQLHLLSIQNPGAAPPGLINYPTPRHNRDTDFQTGLNTHARSRQLQAVLRGEFELTDDITLTSITNYIDTKVLQPQDSDGTIFDVVKLIASGEIKTFTQELRITGKIPDAGIQYIVGANYQKDKITDNIFEPFNQYSALPSGFLIDQRYRLTNRATGLFANIDFEVVPRLTITAGMRYTDTKQTVNGCLFGNEISAGLFGFLAGLSRPEAASAYVPGGCMTIGNVPRTAGQSPDFLPFNADDGQKEDNWSWRAGINYKPTNDSLIYGLVSRGYKAGTYSLTAVFYQSLLQPVTQEELTSYEVGTKLSMFDRALQLNLSAFYYDYKDKQFFTFVPVAPIGALTTFVNIPKSSVKGFDAEITARPFEGFTVRGGVTYIKTKVGTFSGFNAIQQPVNFGGKEFNFAPPWSGTFDAEYRFPATAQLQTYVGFSGLYNSRTFSDLGESPSTRLPARTLFDARVGIESEAGWRLGAWVRNVTNKDYWTSVNAGADTLVRFAGMPRTFGMTGGYRF